MLDIINPIARALTLFMVWTASHYCINEIIRPALLCRLPGHRKGSEKCVSMSMDALIILVIVYLTKTFIKVCSFRSRACSRTYSSHTLRLSTRVCSWEYGE